MKSRFSRFFKDLSFTFVVETSVLIAFFFVYRLISNAYTPQAVGEYAFLRRVSALLQPVLLCGISISLPRFISISSTRGEKSGYAAAAAFTVACIFTVFASANFIFRDFFALIFFGSRSLTRLLPPLFFFLAGIAAHHFTYGILRGELRVKSFNAIQIINLALVPLVVFGIFPMGGMEISLCIAGVAMIAVSALFLLALRMPHLFNAGRISFQKLRTLAGYSAPRAAADFATSALLGLGPVICAHSGGLENAGHLSVGLTLVMGIGGMVAPVGILLLPLWSKKQEEGKFSEIAAEMKHLNEGLLQGFLFASIQGVIFADQILGYWLGRGFEHAVLPTRILLSSLAGYGFYQGVRASIDALRNEPINTWNIFISIAFFFLCTLTLSGLNLLSGILNLAVSSSASLWMLGILSYVSLRRIFPCEANEDAPVFAKAVLINVVFACAALAAKPFAAHGPLQFIAAEGLLSALYIFSLIKLRCGWREHLFERFEHAPR